METRHRPVEEQPSRAENKQNEEETMLTDTRPAQTAEAYPMALQSGQSFHSRHPATLHLHEPNFEDSFCHIRNNFYIACRMHNSILEHPHDTD